jgi:hypothetical protein
VTSGMCIALVAIAGAVVLPTDTITLSWTHTVEGTPWEEDYAVRGGALVLTRARVKRSGAGMDAPDGAVWLQGWWHYAPLLPPLREVVLANSAFAPGYTVCWAGQCRPLSASPLEAQPQQFIGASNSGGVEPRRKLRGTCRTTTLQLPFDRSSAMRARIAVNSRAML